MINRYLTINDAKEDSVFLFGARQTGKTTLLLQLFPENKFYDLLENDTFERFRRNPSLLRQELMTLKDGDIVIIDEIQLIPELLNEVHWLIVRKNLHFILSGSSARKLKRKGVNTLGGRALLNILYPLTSNEVPDFDLIRAINHGMIPSHYLSSAAMIQKKLQAYISVYLKEEIKAEALVRNLNTFNRFLEVAALTNGEMVNYNNIAQDCGIDAKTVKEYFAILEETLMGFMVPAFEKTVKRRLNQAPRFYFFDVALPNYLLKRTNLQPGSEDFGHSFEHLMIQEIRAFLGYNNYENALTFWHTYSGYEVDAVLCGGKTAIEFKSSKEVQSKHLKGLKAFKEEHPEARLIIVSLDKSQRIFNDVEVLPAEIFLKKLWNKEII
ncbi:MAG: ATP-binding protein [Bacteroidales bacterium]|nr:ATP-binding protein [Bacteroidales bacterium]